VMSYFSLKWFMGIMARGNLKFFAFYCFIVGLSVIFFT
jgi:undecaprenyl-diphosphatase